ncbi:hypothetical protein D3C76_1637880 [compost metagenome]
MYYSRKKQLENVIEEATAIWSCTNADCNGWMRDNFVFLHNPTCLQCQSPMVKSEKMLYVVANTSPNQAKH